MARALERDAVGNMIESVVCGNSLLGDKMKILTFVIALATVVAVLASTPNIAGSSTTITLKGGEVSPKKSGDIHLTAQSTNELPGSFSITIERSGESISGGDWKFVVIRENAQGEPSETGAISGSVQGGTLVFADGKISAVTNVQLGVNERTGECASWVTSGTLSGSVERAVSPTFTGTLSF